MAIAVLLHIILLVASCWIGIDAQYDASRDCPIGAGSLCSCKVVPAAGVREIACDNKGIASLPTLKPSTYPFISFQLGKNNLTSLPGNSFSGLNFTELYLNDNNISSIDNETFGNLAAQLKVLDLRNNNLKALPDSLSKLTSIEFLDVSYNPIPYTGFRDPIMRQMGDYIHEFRFGGPQLLEWPETMHHLQALNILKFYGGKMERINMTAFAGFEWTLQKLWIQNTRLIAVPMALQNLKSVEEFHFDNNVFVKDAGILIPAFAGLSHTLETMTLENNSLTVFPSVLQTLGKLTNLSLAKNNLEYINDQAVGVIGGNLTTLNLVDCGLDRIPGALSKLAHLQNLDLSNNSITTIEKNDLQNMHQLVSLNVSFNPLQYVSSGTFHDLTGMKELVMQQTYLYLVPRAIRNIPNLSMIDLSSKLPEIECLCELSWLTCYIEKQTSLHNPTLTIKGECETIAMSIDDYVKVRIRQTCPINCNNP